MIFTEVRFVLVVAGCWVSFFGVPRRYRAHVLTVWGVVFYALYAGSALPLVGALVLGVYGLSRRGAAGIAIAGVAGCLAYFKWGAPPAPIGAGPAATALIPLGLSFLAFELIHFAIERRRGRLGDASLVDLTAFALFFPCRVAGPLKRFGDFTAAVARAEPSLDDVYAGAVRVVVGLVKKVVIADVLALTVAEIGYAATPAHVWKIVLAYSLLIYVDFSAYSDVAIGISRALGIAVPENFRWPYLSPNIQAFWGRWHVTLSSWVRDYVFLPVGHAGLRTPLRRAPLAVAAASYLLSFLVVGAWHGLALNYLAWGAYHGGLLAAHRTFRARLPEAVVTSRLYQSALAGAAGAVVTFTLVSIGWVAFMTDLPGAWRLWRIMFGAG